MSNNSEYTKKITVTLETEAAAHELFAYLCLKWNGVEISENRVIVTDIFNIVEDVWYAICDVDVPDKVLSIQLSRDVALTKTEILLMAQNNTDRPF